MVTHQIESSISSNTLCASIVHQKNIKGKCNLNPTICESCRVNLFNKLVVLGSRDHDTINKHVVFVSTHIVKYKGVDTTRHVNINCHPTFREWLKLKDYFKTQFSRSLCRLESMCT